MVSKICGLIAVVLFTTALITGASAVLSSGSTEEGICPDHPCAGYMYEVAYDEETGKIRSILSWDPTVSDLETLGSGLIAGPGQRTAIIPGDAAVRDIIENAADQHYRFNASTGRIEPVTEPVNDEGPPLKSLTSAATASAAIPVFSLTLGLIMSAVSFIARKRPGQR